MNKTLLVTLLACFVAITLGIQEISMKHRTRTPLESRRFIDYMNRGPMTEKINKIIAKIFPTEMTPNVYAYPEVKIINYLDAQYYGYF